MTFKSRLEKVKRDGRLTTADLAVLLNRPYHTVAGWLQGHNPWGPHGEESVKLLSTIEHAITKRRGFPVPVQLSPVERRRHVTRVRHDLNGGLPKTRTAS